MSNIPGASVDVKALECARKVHPTTCERIYELANRLNSENFSDDDLIELCVLLHRVGLSANAEELLRSGSGPTGNLRDKYVELFGSGAEELFTNSIKAFCVQFNVRLELSERYSYLNDVYRRTCDHNVALSGGNFAMQLVTVQFFLEHSTKVRAIVLVANDCDPRLSNAARALSFCFISDTQVADFRAGWVQCAMQT